MKISHAKEFDESLKELRTAFLFYARQYDKLMKLFKFIIKNKTDVKWIDDYYNLLSMADLKELKKWMNEIIR